MDFSGKMLLKFLLLIFCVVIVESVVVEINPLNANNFFGSNQTLNQQEMILNEMIMAAKGKEVAEGLITPHLFKPSQNFFDVVERINESDLFKMLRQMPKGGVLHAHDTAMCSAEYLLNLTTLDHLWACRDKTQKVFEPKEFKFSLNQPENSKECIWETMTEVRAQFRAGYVDSYLLKRFSMNSEIRFLDTNAAWIRFKGIFRFVSGVLTYEPVWKAYYKNALKEFYEDGVQYLEFRTTLPRLYALNGTYFPQIHTAKVYHDALQEYLVENPSFIGSKLIYGPSRAVNSTVVTNYIEIAKQLKNASGEINFYFHAGETNWFGTAIDENLQTAVELGTKRIGHGFALSKYPETLQRLKHENIAIEVCPISNQVLRLVHDFRNHPSSHFFANNNPVVISSDDRSFWGATPLSHDFYIAFLGIASAQVDLRLLKQLIANSIVYSAMNQTDKKVAFEKLDIKWTAYINWMVESKNFHTVWPYIVT